MSRLVRSRSRRKNARLDGPRRAEDVGRLNVECVNAMMLQRRTTYGTTPEFSFVGSSINLQR